MARTAARRVNSRSENEYAAVSGREIRVRTKARVSEKRIAGRKRTRTSEYTSAMTICRGYILFLALISVLTVTICVHYLNLKTRVERQVRANAALRTELMMMRAENDALYADIENSVNLTNIRDIAMDRYSMNYATQDQIMWYNKSDSGYVRQYQDVPTG